ncbi:hypothetical protein GCM10010302_12340 [Streptomyces polychromogenes]|uniref:Secreted protein n=1 Tax=Streptomyces polychromogenes TaxID=67342 RepID=A0ABP3EUJ0_9ACTN
MAVLHCAAQSATSAAAGAILAQSGGGAPCSQPGSSRPSLALRLAPALTPPPWYAVRGGARRVAPSGWPQRTGAAKVVP